MRKIKKTYSSISLFYALLSGFKINLVGALAVGDLIAVIFNVTNIKRIRLEFLNYPEILKIVKLLFLLIFVQFFSDIYNETSLINMSRGFANILMSIIIIIFLTKLLTKNINVVGSIFLGYSLSILFFGVEIVKNSSISLYDMGFFKFRLVPILNYFLLFILLYLYKNKIITKLLSKKISLIFILYGIFCIVFDARSNGLFYCITGFLTANSSLITQLKKRFFIIIPLLIIVFQGFYTYYISNILSGSIKSEHTKKQIEYLDNPYNPLNLLFSGRSEIYGSTLAIIDKPFLGHGSWAIDRGGKYTFYTAKREDQKNYLEHILKQRGQNTLPIPSHSVLLGAWVSCGIIGFLIILRILIIYISIFMKLFSNSIFKSSIYFPIIIVLSINVIWIFLFSPLSELKSGIPLPLVILIIVFRKLSLVIKPSNDNKMNKVIF